MADITEPRSVVARKSHAPLQLRNQSFLMFDFVLIFTGFPSPGLLAGSLAAGGEMSLELFDLVLVFVTPCDGVGTVLEAETAACVVTVSCDFAGTGVALFSAA